MMSFAALSLSAEACNPSSSRDAVESFHEDCDGVRVEASAF
jgi:hypothetical protein